MKRTVTTLALGLAAALAGDTPPAAAVAPETLRMLDPSRIAAGLCGTRRGAAALQARLQLAAALVQAAAPGDPAPIDVPDAIRLPVTSGSPAARAYLRQGLLLSYGFNHEAAIAAFRAAQRADPACAICFWGEAFALGPNINAPMAPEALPGAIAATGQAMALREGASPQERALIEAMARRYGTEGERAALDAAYADAMLAAAARFPEEDDIALIAAEAAMDTTPWNYWQADRRTPQPRIGEAVNLVETVLARSPGHPQASHLYIHLMENNADPTRAEAAADRLAAAPIPAAGHLVHMPGHIYYRLGRFADSIRVNVDAARADEAYLAAVEGNPVYRYGYYPHNVHFLLASAQMAGAVELVPREAARLAGIVSPEVAAQAAWVQPVVAAPYLAFAQYGSPEAILALGEADARLPYVVAMRHYARAVALARQRDRVGFERELAAMRAIREGDGVRPVIDQGVPARDLIRIAELVAQGRRAYAERRFGEAARHYAAAAAIEDTIPYTEPPYWYYPVRQSLGAALLRLGRAAEARDAFRAALAQSPNNGWALYGLAEAERALGRRVEAAAAEAALARAWLRDRNWLSLDRL